jgi:predicted nucleic acid-binding Zn ribbon protein
VKHARSCTYCGQPMPGKRRNKYCSETCRTASRLSKRPVKICPICEAEFIPRSSRAQFCSRNVRALPIPRGWLDLETLTIRTG